MDSSLSAAAVLAAPFARNRARCAAVMRFVMGLRSGEAERGPLARTPGPCTVRRESNGADQTALAVWAEALSVTAPWGWRGRCAHS
jgi:hypothetical protein